MDDTGTTLANGEPTVKMSSAPDRTWLKQSVLPPSWLFGKIWISTRPLVAARISSTASAGALVDRMCGRQIVAVFQIELGRFSPATGEHWLQ